MFYRKVLFFLLVMVQGCFAGSLAEQLRERGFVEICDDLDRARYHALYACFDKFIEFLQVNPAWEQKIFSAKERFIRSKWKNFYSTDVFGFYDESKNAGRSQISFYYSTHLHEFIRVHFPEILKIPEISCFLDACFDLQNPCGNLFINAAKDLGLDYIFDTPPILLKVIKYFPSYYSQRPHYDGTAFSLFLNSTDNEALLLSPYKSSFTVEDFSPPIRTHQNSILLIPGILLTEFSIYPTPHIVLKSGKIRYATIAFAMRPNYTHEKVEFSNLPLFKN